MSVGVGLYNSPTCELKTDQSSYFSLHMPSTYISNDKACAGYFDVEPQNDGKTPYFDAQKCQPVETPYFDCEPVDTPYFEELKRKSEARLNGGVDGTSSTPACTSFCTSNNTLEWLRTASLHSSLPRSKLLRQPNKPSVRPSLQSLTCTAASPPAQSFHIVSANDLADLIRRQALNESLGKTFTNSVILLLDLRAFSQFAENHIRMAVNICVPSTLLRRGSFTLDKVCDMLVSDYDKQVFGEWEKFENIVLYDSDTQDLKEGCSLTHLCKKFKLSGCKANIGWLKGGFMAFCSKYTDLCEHTESIPSAFPRRTFSAPALMRKPGAFTCPTPVIEIDGVNPFFSNIRQNYELIGGITEKIPVRFPEGVRFEANDLPAFLRDICSENGGKDRLAEAFYDIERTEQRRLQSLMLQNANKPTADFAYSISAGIEKGTKNRYNNIWPYDHARVKLGACKGECDYINASYVQADESTTRYIATQGPMPATYEDFWKVVWEQNCSVIVMLTKEEEAGRIQCHKYWSDCPKTACKFGKLSLLNVSENTLRDNTGASVIIRKFSLTNSDHANVPPRIITQLHFLVWPDFGVPDCPLQLLRLINMANQCQAESGNTGPMVVHCSAGCGRTGAFCTVDTVLKMLKQNENMRDIQQDVIKYVVEKFREQRLSMVQNLRQFVFCYEAVIWALLGAA
ncbi:6414_t:CDS:2 [Paraglomus occultum]|uniref:protein-tyrosine-phosphatase n=1 Tax=Paraglomus occultum TaxID=144539 RepID=A0A9N9FLC8_9GLOM|nr:6414_t:CDS:2 [Paraglomus occultum]